LIGPSKRVGSEPNRVDAIRDTATELRTSAEDAGRVGRLCTWSRASTLCLRTTRARAIRAWEAKHVARDPVAHVAAGELAQIRQEPDDRESAPSASLSPRASRAFLAECASSPRGGDIGGFSGAHSPPIRRYSDPEGIADSGFQEISRLRSREIPSGIASVAGIVQGKLHSHAVWLLGHAIERRCVCRGKKDGSEGWLTAASRSKGGTADNATSIAALANAGVVSCAGE